MANKYKNDKGFLVIEMNYEEAKEKCLFGTRYVDKHTGEEIKHFIVCDTCNNLITDKIYYVACINRALCQECCDDFINNMKRYPEDISYEVRHYNFYAEKLGLELEKL